MDDHDNKIDNELIVTGAVFAALVENGQFAVEIPPLADNHGNSVWVRVPFMQSRYRVTVEMDPE